MTVDTEYTGTSLDGIVTVSGGIQSWVVPEAGTYQITALGAAGGTQQYTGDEGSGTVSPGGLGASIQGTFELTAGETIYVLVGQMGGDTKADTDTDGDWESAAPVVVAAPLSIAARLTHFLCWPQVAAVRGQTVRP